VSGIIVLGGLFSLKSSRIDDLSVNSVLIRLIFFSLFGALAARYKLSSIPLEAKNISLGQKRKRARVAKAKIALIVQ